MKKLVILGAGFAGVWAALAARRLAEKNGGALAITLISKSQALGIRPRFYEDNLEHHAVALSDIFKDLNVRIINAAVVEVDTKSRIVRTSAGEFVYDALINALGSEVSLPKLDVEIPVFSIDSLTQAQDFKKFLNSTSFKGCLRIIVVGGGFTGLEAAMELPKRLRLLGCENFEISIVDRNQNIAPEFGPNARKQIFEALNFEGIKIHTSVSIAHQGENGIVLSNGTVIPAQALLWTGGVQPSPISAQISGVLDKSQRHLVNEYLQVPDQDFIWAAGDVAAALVDGKNRSVMSCQHAIPQGKIAGLNAAAKLLGLPQIRYRQELYVVCLDLGDWGALVTAGWGRNKVLATKESGKALKKMINRVTIYPQLGDPKKLLASAHPDNIGILKAKVAEVALAMKPLRNLITSTALKANVP